MDTLTHGEVLARFGHALSDTTRARLLLALRDAPGYPAELADLIGVTRQNLSNHLACLRSCGLVVAVPQGRRTRYELADRRIRHALDDLLGLVLTVDPAAADQDHCRPPAATAPPGPHPTPSPSTEPHPTPSPPPEPHPTPSPPAGPHPTPPSSPAN